MLLGPFFRWWDDASQHSYLSSGAILAKIIVSVYLTSVLSGPLLAQAKARPNDGDQRQLLELLAKVRQRAAGIAALKTRAAATRTSSAAAHARFDPGVFSSVSVVKDRSELPTPGSGDHRQGYEAEAGLQQTFASGLEARIAYKQNYQHQFASGFNPLIAPSINAGGETVAGPNRPTPGTNLPDVPYGAGQSSAANDSRRTDAIELELRQPLWQGLGLPEVGWQEDLITGSAALQELTALVQLQELQANAERLYWTLLQNEAQYHLIEQLLEMAERYQKLMEGRQGIGRADQVDVATSEAQRVSIDGELVATKIEVDEYRQRLARLIDPDALTTEPSGIHLNSVHLSTDKLVGSNSSDEVQDSTKVPSRQPVPSSPAAVLQLALDHRQDLKAIAIKRTAVTTELQMTSATSQPKVDLIASLAVTGSDPTRTESAREVLKAKRPKASLGLAFSYNLGQTAVQSKERETDQLLNALDLEQSAVIHEVKGAIDLAFNQYKYADQLQAQAERHLATLRKRQQLEERLFAQARSEEIVAISYEMQLIRAKGALLRANLRRQLAEVDLRATMHLYPSDAARN